MALCYEVRLDPYQEDGTLKPAGTAGSRAASSLISGEEVFLFWEERGLGGFCIHKCETLNKVFEGRPNGAIV